MTTALPKSLLILDDDLNLRERLKQAMVKRGFDVTAVASLGELETALKTLSPHYAVLDMRLDDGNGLSAVAKLKQRYADCRIVMLTAYGNIASAVSAIKAGAVDYLAKPADADMVMAALLADKSSTSLPPPPENPMPADRARWEHILRVYEQCARNVSETARRLKMHRRTLQRILSKHAPAEHKE